MVPDYSYFFVSEFHEEETGGDGQINEVGHQPTTKGLNRRVFFIGPI